MNFLEAQKLIKTGVDMIAPHSKRVYKVNEDGDVYTSDWGTFDKHHGYLAEDVIEDGWSRVDYEGLTFAQAFKALKKGKTIRRNCNVSLGDVVSHMDLNATDWIIEKKVTK